MKKSIFSRIHTALDMLLVVTFLSFLLSASTFIPGNRIEQVRVFTRNIEFDFVRWTFDAMRLKLEQSALGIADYFPVSQRRRFMLNYLNLVSRIHSIESQVYNIYSDPAITDPATASSGLRATLSNLRQRQKQDAPLAEAILQNQISQVVADMGLAVAGQPVPPVLYHSTPLPWALIVSPRDIIRQDADISLETDMTVDQFPPLEEKVDKALNVSSLVVAIGGVGLYPTMVQHTDDLDWLSEVVSHEWVHNFLTLRPLGINYYTSPQLRVMNETTANIAGKEIGAQVLERFYPELVPPTQVVAAEQPKKALPSEPPAFDYYDEMHTTRVEADRLLAEGKIEEAEKYMEKRRQVFWENGYRIRKLNQAYFAFHGAYADHPSGGAAGEDPVGAAVRKLRAQSPTLATFLNHISWMASVEDLEHAIQSGQP